MQALADSSICHAPYWNIRDIKIKNLAPCFIARSEN